MRNRVSNPQFLGHDAIRYRTRNFQITTQTGIEPTISRSRRNRVSNSQFPDHDATRYRTHNFQVTSAQPIEQTDRARETKADRGHRNDSQTERETDGQKKTE